MRRVPFVIAASLLFLRGASAQPVPAAHSSSNATILVVDSAAAARALEPPIPGTPIPSLTPVPAAPAGARAPAPGDELKMLPGSFTGDPGTVLGDAAIYAALSPLQKAWFLREFHRGRGDEEAAKEALSRLVELRIDSGLWNATSYASALDAESRAAVKTGHGPDAILAAKAATELAPDYPTAHLTLARAYAAGGEIGSAPAELEAASSAAIRNLRVRVRLLGNVLLAVLAGAWLAFAIFLALALIRHGRFLAHDFRHAFTDKMPGWLAGVLLVPVLAFPLVFGLGALPLLAWLTILLWLQMSLRERIVAGAFLLLGAATPAITRQIGATLAFEGRDEGRLYHAIREDEVDAHSLASLTATGMSEKDTDTLLTVANIHLRAGQYAQAEDFYRRAAEAGAGPSADVGVGVVHYGTGDVAGAIAAFDRALAADPQHVSAHFDLSQIYAERTELEKSQSNLLAAKALDAKRCDHLLSAPLPPARKSVAGTPGLVTAAYLNHFLMLDEVGDDRLLARVFQNGAADAVVRQTWKQLSPALSLPAVGSIFIASFAVALGLTGVFRGVIPARPCPRCGRGLCLRCDGPPLEDDLCVQCFHTFLDTKGTDPRIRAEKERDVERHHDRLRMARRILSFLVPGGGLIFGGRTVRGTVILLLASVLAVRLALWNGVLRPIFPDGGNPMIALVLVGVALAAVWLDGMRGAAADPEKGR